jgi:hypothetical protein
LKSRHDVQPTNDATAMWANDFRSSSQASHFCSLPPRPKLANSALGLCQALAERGFRFVTVDELLGVPAYRTTA